MLNKFFLSFLFLIVSLVTYSQSSQAEYLEAKRLMGLGQYTAASGAFSSLFKDPNFGRLSKFYQAYCTYKGGNSKTAIALWEEQLKNPQPWRGKVDVIFWLAYSNLESGLFADGISYAEKLTNETYSSKEERGLLQTFLAPLSPEQLKSLYALNPENRFIGEILLKKESERPFSERDLSLIRDLIELNGSAEALQEVLPTIKKDQYHVAVLLPFMIDKNKPEWVLQNQLVMGLYQGMQLAEKDLKSKGISLNLVPYDTRRDEGVTQKALDQLPMSTDLIVGPLYPGPTQAVGKFSLDNKINMINPVSSNSEVILNNPYSFLFKPSYETLAAQLASYSVETYSNKNVMIFYENVQRDSLIAAIYKRQMEENGFKVAWFQEINKTNAKSILDTLTAKYEVYYTKAQADSVLLIPGRFVKERRLRRDELDRLTKIAEGKINDSVYYRPVTINDDHKEVTYYENVFYMKPDSIGHIFGATRNNALVNNLISAVETKGNNIGLLGYGEWIDFTMLSYNQLERIGVVLAHPDFYDPSSAAAQQFATRVKADYFTEPSIYHCIGYEMITQAGTLMSIHGKYFQNGIRSGDVFPGVLFQGVSYGPFNDNQVVPLVRFQNNRLTPIIQTK